jgi:nucleotide-binding universal stress UspA family protein
MSTLANAPVLLGYDGSAEAQRAIEYAAGLFHDRPAVVLNVWSLAPVATSFGMISIPPSEVDAHEQSARATAENGAAIARAAGLEARPQIAEGTIEGVWRTILQVADHLGASAIVVGSRGLTGVRSIVLGSVSSGVVHHAHRPVLVVPDAADTNALRRPVASRTASDA